MHRVAEILRKVFDPLRYLKFLNYFCNILRTLTFALLDITQLSICSETKIGLTKDADRVYTFYKIEEGQEKMEEHSSIDIYKIFKE